METLRSSSLYLILPMALGCASKTAVPTQVAVAPVEPALELPAEPLLEPVIERGFLVPQIDAVWQVGSATVVGLYWFSFEGVHFDALLISGDDASMHELGYLYRCAY